MTVSSVLYANEYATFWAAAGAIAQGAASLLGLIALIYSIMAFRRSFKSMHYAELDRMYFDLLRIAVEKPHLRTPPLSRIACQVDYDSYAFMVWNFLETVYDRCQEEPALLKLGIRLLRRSGASIGIGSLSQRTGKNSRKNSVCSCNDSPKRIRCFKVMRRPYRCLRCGGTWYPKIALFGDDSPLFWRYIGHGNRLPVYSFGCLFSRD